LAFPAQRRFHKLFIIPAAAAVAAAVFTCGAVAPAVSAAGSRSNRRQATGWTPRVETSGNFDAAEVRVNGALVIRLRKWQGTLSPDDRVAIAADRLRTAFAVGARPEDVSVDLTTDRTAPRVKVAGQVVATATKEEAKVSSSSPVALASSWASALKRALALPGLMVSEAGGVIVPLNESRTLKVGGAARGDIAIAAGSGADVLAASATDGTAPKSIVSVTLDPVTGDLRLTGTAPGRDTLTLTREGASISVPVAVQPYAGRFEGPQTVTITGPGHRRGRRGPARDRGGTGGCTAQLRRHRPRHRRDARGVRAPARREPAVDGSGNTVRPGHDPVSRTVSVVVANRSFPAAPTGTLFYSNNPERLTQYGTLFVGRLTNEKATSRLLFHHQSALAQAAWFNVELVNDAAEPAQVQVVGGASGPVRDTVWVGYRAASDFLKLSQTDSGAVVTVPARSRVALVATRLGPGLTISGLMQLRVVSAGKTAPVVRVAADLPGAAGNATSEWLPFPMRGGEAEGVAAFAVSEHIYPNPTKKLTTSYSVGGTWAFVSIGREAIASGASSEVKLLGNYGVTYEIDAALENPGAAPARVRVLFEPSAGLAGGVFYVDGRPVEIPQTNIPNEPLLAEYTLAPGEKRTVKIQTVPLSGSNYPVRVIVRP
jgi:hypothetical protein